MRLEDRNIGNGSSNNFSSNDGSLMSNSEDDEENVDEYSSAEEGHIDDANNDNHDSNTLYIKESNK